MSTSFVVLHLCILSFVSDLLKHGTQKKGSAPQSVSQCKELPDLFGCDQSVISHPAYKFILFGVVQPLIPQGVLMGSSASSAVHWKQANIMLDQLLQALCSEDPVYLLYSPLCLWTS